METQELDNLPRLNVALGEYLNHTKLTIDEALLKQGRKLSFEVSRRMRRFAPAKGSIRSERAGKGVRVRDSIARWEPKRRKRGQSLREARRERELGLRERARGFLAFGTRLNLAGLRKGSRVAKQGQFQQQLAEAGLRFDTDSQTLRVVYGGDRTELGDALSQPRQARAINAALGEVAADIELYLDRKMKGTT